MRRRTLLWPAVAVGWSASWLAADSGSRSVGFGVFAVVAGALYLLAGLVVATPVFRTCPS